MKLDKVAGQERKVNEAIQAQQENQDFQEKKDVMAHPEIWDQLDFPEKKVNIGLE